MESQTSKKKLKSRFFTRLLFIIGSIVIAWGVLGGIARVVMAITLSESSVYSGVSNFQMFALVPYFLLVHVAAGAACLGMGKAIQILEEIRTAA